MNVQRRMLVGAVAAATLGLVPAGLAIASAGSASSTTIKLLATQTGQNFGSKTMFEETGKDTKGGKLLGYYTLSCKLSSATAGKCGGAASFPGGMTYFKFPLKTTSRTFSGKITGGTGAYSGASGTINGKTISSKKTEVTLVIK